MGQKRFIFLLAMLAFWVVVTVVSERFDWDRSLISTYFYLPETGFFRAQEPLFQWFFQKGTYAGPILTLSAAFFWALGYFRPRMQKYQRQFLVVLLTALVGGGILVNGFLKDYWGRPRPREVKIYAGLWNYHPISELGTPGKGKSFPCGHCTSAFLATSLWVFIPTNPVLGTLAVIAGLTYGSLMSMARMAQGGHFPTDAFWALGVVAQVSLLFYLLLVRPQSRARRRGLSRKGRIWLTFGLLVFSVAVVIAFMSRRPYFKSYQLDLDVPQTTKQLELQFNIQPSQFKVRYQPLNAPGIHVDVQGLGWTEATHGLKLARTGSKDSTLLKVQLNPIGYYSEIHHLVVLTLPLSLQHTVQITTTNHIDPPLPE